MVVWMIWGQAHLFSLGYEATHPLKHSGNYTVVTRLKPTHALYSHIQSQLPLHAIY
jgi:hypothetical protein